jgi:hypothetical protein
MYAFACNTCTQYHAISHDCTEVLMFGNRSVAIAAVASDAASAHGAPLHLDSLQGCVCSICIYIYRYTYTDAYTCIYICICIHTYMRECTKNMFVGTPHGCMHARTLHSQTGRHTQTHTQTQIIVQIWCVCGVVWCGVRMCVLIVCLWLCVCVCVRESVCASLSLSSRSLSRARARSLSLAPSRARVRALSLSVGRRAASH